MTFNPDLPDIISLVFGATILLSVVILILVSAKEKEFYAVKKSLILLLFSAPFLIIPFLDFPYQDHVLLGISGLTAMAFLILVFPINKRTKIVDYTFSNKVDEHNIMFT